MSSVTLLSTGHNQDSSLRRNGYPIRTAFRNVAWDGYLWGITRTTVGDLDLGTRDENLRCTGLVQTHLFNANEILPKVDRGQTPRLATTGIKDHSPLRRVCSRE